MTTTPDPGAAPDPNQSPTPTGPTQPAPPPYVPGDPAAYQPSGPVGYTSPGPQGYFPPPMAPKRKTPWLAIAILIGIVVFIGVVLWVVRNQANVNDLGVGDCFDEPSVTSSITDVQRQPCNVAHDDEVFFLVTDPASGAYPGVAHFRELASAQCLPAASAYLGTDFTTRADIEAGYLYPTSESWDSGDRGVTCYLYRVDEGQLTASLKNIGTAPLP